MKAAMRSRPFALVQSNPGIYVWLFRTEAEARAYKEKLLREGGADPATYDENRGDDSLWLDVVRVETSPAPPKLSGDPDTRWDWLMREAEALGFIVGAAGGTATLATHAAQRGAGIYEKTQKMNGYPALR